jgi:beta-lactamase regulating signal transducer with metallopeptidase domain
MLERMVAFFAQPAVERLGWSLVHFLWQGAVAALLLAAVLAWLPRAAVGPRYLAACATLLLMAACPLATCAWLWIVAAGRPAVASGPAASAATIVDGHSPAADSAAVRLAPTPPKEMTAPPAAVRDAAAAPALPVPAPQLFLRVEPVLPWLVAAWLAGVSVLTGRLCAGWVQVYRWRHRAVRQVAAEWQVALERLAVRVRVSRSVTLLESALVEVPTLIGWLRPAILLPASALAQLTARQLESILAHELAHVRRHDYLVNLLQTAIETALFYHPAVWWASRFARAEREACCDELAVAVCGDRLGYARALASLEELRAARPRLALAASGGPLSDRIRRLVGAPQPPNRSAWWIVAAAAAAVIALFAWQGPSGTQAEGPDERPDAQANDEAAGPAPAEPEGDGGPPSDGLRFRLIAVPAATDDESPDIRQTTESFARADDVTFAVELKNVGDKPVVLLGVRYGDSYPTAEGQLNTGFFAPHLFEIEFTDAAGTPVPRPHRELLSAMLELSGASTHELAPGESLVELLRPTRFQSPMQYELPGGDLRVRMRYRGPSRETLAQIARHWPDKPQTRAWSGEVESNEVAFTVAADPAAAQPELAWGAPQNGLQAAVEFRQNRTRRSPDDPPGMIPLNTVLDAVLHLKNVGEGPISLVSESWRQDDTVTVINEAGEEQMVGGSWYTGVPIMVHWTLQPGEVAQLQASNLAVAADQAALDTLEHPVGKSLIAPPGKYTVSYSIRLGNLQSRDEQGNVLIPGQEDWQGSLATGETTLTVRPRAPEDDAREREPTFVGKIEFVGPGSRAIESGTFTASTSGQRREPAEYALHAGPIDLADCTTRPLTVYVRAAGYEEAVFYDVKLPPDETRRIELAPAVATRFRLVSAADGAPLAGAQVRYFNKTCGKASAGPYPMRGTAGPVWTTSAADGSVVLDTMQRIDPYYDDLGDAVYFFYIETPGLAPRFLGPVKAGQDLGDVPVGPFLEVRGEVRGTPEELERFAAEWDQPFELTTDNPEAAWIYAVSQTLETTRDGDRLTFHLTGLRPGRLRIVANFGPHPHQVQHTYTRRDPQGSDIVVEVELKESIADLVVTPAGLAAEDADGP